jgi:hypothetical protein
MRIYKKTIDRVTAHGTRMEGGFFTIPIHRELYLCKRIRQKTKTRFGFKFWTDVALQTFFLPTEYVDFIVTFVDKFEGKSMSVEDIECFRAGVVLSAKSTAQHSKDHLESLGDKMSDDMKKQISWSIDSSVQRVHDMFTAEIDESDLNLTMSLTSTGHHLISKETRGITTTYIFAKVMDGGVVFVSMETGKVRGQKIIFSIEQFDLTLDFAKTLVENFAISTVDSAGKE